MNYRLSIGSCFAALLLILLISVVFEILRNIRRKCMIGGCVSSN